MKQLFILLFGALLLPLGVQAQYTYTTNSGAITITGYTGPGGTVTIPDIINGYPVTSIGDDAFWYNNNLTNLIVGTNVLSIGANTFAFSTNLISVIIPNSVTNIGGGAFQYCTNMTSITMGNGLLSVGGSAFAFDASLVGLYFEGNAPTFVSLTSVFYAVHGATIYYNADRTGWAAGYDALSTATIQSQYQYSSDGMSITITNYTGPGGAVAIPAAITSLPVTSLGFDAFYGSAITIVTIPDSVTNIGDDAFDNNKNLLSVTISDSVTSIGQGAFSVCPSLTSITIPDSVTSIGSAPFYFCMNLSAITVASQNPAYTSVGGVLFDKNQITLIEYPGGLAGAYVIPMSVTSIGQEAFGDCYSLTSITIPNSVTSIGEDAFIYCTDLSAITVAPQNPIYSSVGGVLYNKNLTTLITCPEGFAGAYVITNSVTSIGDVAFFYCSGLTSVTIPNSVTSLGESAFYNCPSLTKLLFQGNPPSLGGLNPNLFGYVNVAAKVYYLEGTIGWGTTYGGLPTVELYLPVLRSVSVAGGFGFAVTGVTNVAVVVEASTNLVNWQPIQTNSTPPFQFNDVQWTNYPIRFYRVHYAP